MEAVLGVSYPDAVDCYHEALYQVCDGLTAISGRGGRLLEADEKLGLLHKDISDAVVEIGLNDVDLVIEADVTVLSCQNRESLKGIKQYSWDLCGQVTSVFLKVREYTNRVIANSPRRELIEPLIEDCLCELAFDIEVLTRSALFIEKYIDAALKDLDRDCPPAQKKMRMEKVLSPPQVKRFKRDEEI